MVHFSRPGRGTRKDCTLACSNGPPEKLDREDNASSQTIAHPPFERVWQLDEHELNALLSAVEIEQEGS